MATHKMSVRIGNASFEVEGEEAKVCHQYDQFLDALRSAPVDERKFNRAKAAIGYTYKGGDLAAALGAGGDKACPLSADELRRHVFGVSGNGIVHVNNSILTRNLPPGNVLVLLLYGFHALTGQSDILAADLLTSAKSAGLDLERVDRLFPNQNPFVFKSGTRRGSRYRLTDAGLDWAEETINALLE